MKKNHGFTLIELVIVIVILGVLAATAIPKFTDLSSDSRRATVQGLKGALTTGAALVHAKAVLEGVDSGTDSLTLNGGTISVRSGYPRVASNCSNFTSQLTYWLSVELDDSVCTQSSDSEWYGYVSSNTFYFMPDGYTDISEQCYVTYETASERVSGSWVDTDSATVSASTDGC